MNKILLLLFFSLPVLLHAQSIHDGLKFSQTEFYYPKEENWVSSIDTIQITNTTNKIIYLLKQSDPKNFELRFPAKGIEPGKTENIEVIFKPRERGKFNFSFPIYQGSSLTPILITYNGEIVSFDEFADVACPSFYTPNLKPPVFQLEVNVIDSATKKQLSNSYIEISKGEYYTSHTTDVNGYYRQAATINYYVVYAEHKGYAGRSVGKHINPKHRIITIVLPATTKPEIIIPADTIKTTIAIKKEVIPVTPHDSVREFSLSTYKKNNIIFLIDKSSSMNKPDRMPLLQAAMIQLANMTRPEDRVTIITYANEANILLQGVQGNEHQQMVDVINQLHCGGRTEGGKAIHTAYKNAEKNFIEGGVNQIIIATDGGFNGLAENEDALMKVVDAKAKKEIKLSVLAFGENRFGKAMITRLAKHGQGFYVFIGNDQDAKVLLTDAIKQQSKL